MRALAILLGCLGALATYGLAEAVHYAGLNPFERVATPGHPAASADPSIAPAAEVTRGQGSAAR